MICDFCSVERTELWGFPVGSFVERIYDVTNVAGEWAICDDCKLLLDAYDLPALLARVLRFDPLVTKDNIDTVERFYSLLVLNITGPLVRCASQTDPLYGP